MGQEYSRLRADKLIETADRLASRVVGRFPQASLGNVAVAVADVTRNAVATAEHINRPNWALRIALIALAVVIVAVAVTLAVVGISDSRQALELARVASGAGLWLSAVAVFFWTLETRLRRGKVVKALHELRGLAHIIDMHQLSKDPECGPESDPTYNREGLGYYLNYCSEMLAILSKIGQLYVEDFPDGTTLAAVDQLERLTTSLSQKIWQKVMILEQIRGEEQPAK
jgi:hypothetical protein